MNKNRQKNYPSFTHLTEESLDDNSSLKKMLSFIGGNKQVVDFGCASGYFAQVLNTRGCIVTGVEINSLAAEQAKQHCREVIVADLDFVSIAEILPNQKFDVAVFGDVLEHLRNPGKVLEDTKAILKEDGFIVASIPNIAHGAIRLALLKGEFEYTELGILDNTHLRFFTRKTIEQLFDQSGYIINAIDCTKVDIFSGSNLIPTVKPEEFSIDLLQQIEQEQDANTLQFIVKATHYSIEAKYNLLRENYSIQAKHTQQLKSQLEQTQSELERSQSQLQQTQERLGNLELRIKQINQQERQNQLKINQQERQNQLKTDLLNNEIDLLNNEIAAMKTSKFWKLRTLWFEFKLRVKLLAKKLPIYPNLKELYRSFAYSSKLKTNNQVPLPEKGIVINETLNHKEILTKTYTAYLHNFLNSNTKLKLPTHSQPLISIILVLYNRAELTLQCLISLAANCAEPFEVIIVDNASSDSTKALLNRIEGAKIILNNQNLHFLLASNQAAKEAVGKYILFLNNDAQVLPGSITSAIKTITESEDIGAVGGKIILLDGTLQEAGSIVWQDGSCLGYGRGDNPNQPMYMFRRDVDYCSGAFLLTKRHLFVEKGGFDQDYQPAYYEETDYCMRLWRMNQRVVYDPNVIILHYEFASSKTVNSALSLQTQHREIFLSKHKEKLQHHYSPDPSNILMARETNHYCGRILFLDDRVPHSFLGSGFPRARDILYSLLKLNYFVTLYPLQEDNYYEEDWNTAYQDIPSNVEIMLGYGLTNFEEFIFNRGKYYDVIFISRPHNFKAVQPIIAKQRKLFPDLKIIYDAEALFSLRDISRNKLQGYQVLDADINDALAKELELPRDADRITVVSEQEGKKFTEFGYDQVYTLGHLISVSPTQNTFESRSDILFVGSIPGDDSPNADSIFWFVKEIWPIICKSLGTEINFNIVGLIKSQKILDLRCENIKMFGTVDDLQILFDSARIFVAPTRFAAGVPMKVHTSAGYGLPIVTTSLIASQVNWENGTDLLTADDHLSFAEQCICLYTQSELWQMLRNNALNKINRECSREAFVKNLQKIVQF